MGHARGWIVGVRFMRRKSRSPLQPNTPTTALVRIAPPWGLEARRWNCGKCGYDLAGLPDGGSCPECGEHWRKGEIEVLGWVVPHNVPSSLTAMAGGLLCVLVISGVATLKLFPVIVRAPTYAGLTPLFFSITIAMLGLVFLSSRWQRRRRGPLRVTFNADGMGLSILGKDTWHPKWGHLLDYGVTRLRDGLWQLRARFQVSSEDLGRGPRPAGEEAAETWLVFRGSRRDAAFLRNLVRRRSGIRPTSRRA